MVLKELYTEKHGTSGHQGA